MEGIHQICPSVRPKIRTSGCLSPQKRSITFEQGNVSYSNFQGHTNSLQVIFWWANQTTGPTGLGLDPKKGVNAKFISSQSFEVRWLCHTFLDLGQQGKKMLGEEF